MTQVMRQSYSFRKVFIKLKGFTNRTGNLRDFKGVGKTSSVIIAFMVDEYLGFIFQPSECRCVDDSIAVSLKPGSVLMFLFLMLASFTLSAFHCVGSKGVGFKLFEILPLDQNAT
jgi:hypothetical protein